MNDRLRIASEQLAAAIATPDCWGSLENMAKRALATADALLAAAGDREAREPRPGEIDRAYLAQHNDALAGALETAIARAEAAEAKVAELEAKLAAAARLASDSAEQAMELIEPPVMTSPTPKASGPLWAWADSSGALQIGSLSPVEGSMTRFPVRVVPGHGKVVSVELVEAIAAEYNRLLMRIPAPADGPCRAAMSATTAAIRAALEGAV